MSQKRKKLFIDKKRQMVRGRFYEFKEPGNTHTPILNLCTIEEYKFKRIGNKKVERSIKEKELFLIKIYNVKKKELKKTPIEIDKSKNELLKKHKKLILVFENERVKTVKLLQKIELLSKSPNTSDSDNSAVYFIKGIHTETFKIGVSSNYLNRFKELRTSCSEPLVMVGIIRCFHISHAMVIEKALHVNFEDRVTGGGTEWFYISDKEATESINKYNGYVLSV
jgi:hypothetical protein